MNYCLLKRPLNKKNMLIIIKIKFRILQNKNQLKLLILQMWMVKNNQKHLKKKTPILPDEKFVQEKQKK